MLTTAPVGSKAKLFGAVTTEVVVVQVELSSSATNASFTVLPTNSGNSSEKKRKSTERQLALLGTLRSSFRIVTSRSLLPRIAPPPSLAPEFEAVLGSSARVASPVERIPYRLPVSAKEVSGE